MDIFEKRKREWTTYEQRIPVPIDSYRAYLSKLDIDIYSLAEQTVRALEAEIQDLQLPREIETHVRNGIHNCDLSFVANTKEGSYASNMSHVAIDIDQILRISYRLATITKQPFSPDLIRSLFVAVTSHELGHIVDMSFKGNNTSRDDHCSSTISLNSNFPIIKGY